MGAAAGGASGGYQRRNSRRRSSSRGVMSEINVTPLVDVMLVLLIVFMVAAPLMTISIPIKLPEMTPKAADVPVERLTITLKEDRTLFLQETQVPANQLVSKLVAIAKNGHDQSIAFRGDENVKYGAVIEIFDLLRNAGFTKIDLDGLAGDARLSIVDSN